MLTSYEKLLISRFLMPGIGGRLTLLLAIIGFAGIAIGVSSLVLVVSFMNGAEARLAGQVASADGHIFVTGRRGGIMHPARLERKFRNLEGVESAVASLNGSGLISVNGRALAADLQGIAPSRMASLPAFKRDSAMLMGNVPAREHTLALGSDLASRLGVGLGEHAAVASIRFDGANLVVENYDFVVAGIVSTDVPAFDSRRAILPLDEARVILNTTYRANRINVYLENESAQHEPIAAIGRKLGAEYVITTWQSMNRVLFSALAQERVAMTTIISIVTIIALSNILSSMVMLVRYKSREIAILRTMGMSRASIAKVFIGVGAAIGLVGEAAGIGIGLSLKAAKDPAVQLLRTMVAHPPVEMNVMLSLPLAISGTELGWIVALVSLAVLVSTLYPAYRATAVDPVQVLRYN